MTMTKTKTASRPVSPPTPPDFRQVTGPGALDESRIDPPPRNQDDEDVLVPLRKFKLRELISKSGRGGATALANKAGVTHGYVSQISRPGFNFGARAARELEQRLGLPHLFFDTPAEPAGHSGSAYLVPVLPWGLVGRSSAPAGSPVVPVGWRVGPRAVAAVSHGAMWSGEVGIPRGWLAIIDPDAPRRDGDILAVWLPGATECTLRQHITDAGRQMLAPLDPRMGTIDELTKAVKVVGPVVGALKSYR